jgi:hypothetical protein
MMLFESAPHLAQPQHRVREHMEAGGHEHPAAQPAGASLPA